MKTRQAKSKLKPRWRLVAILAAGILVALVGSLAVWANLGLSKTTHVYPKKTAYIYTYELELTPAKPISGQPISFRLRLTKGGQPARGYTIKAGLTHSYGLFINARDDETPEYQLTTDNEGVVEFTHTPQFWSLREDGGFGIYAAPILNEAEKKLLRDQVISGEVSANVNTAVNYDMPTIYPRWLNWFLWR